MTLYSFQQNKKEYENLFQTSQRDIENLQKWLTIYQSSDLTDASVKTLMQQVDRLFKLLARAAEIMEISPVIPQGVLIYAFKKYKFFDSIQMQMQIRQLRQNCHEEIIDNCPIDTYTPAQLERLRSLWIKFEELRQEYRLQLFEAEKNLRFHSLYIQNVFNRLWWLGSKFYQIDTKYPAIGDCLEDIEQSCKKVVQTLHGPDYDDFLSLDGPIHRASQRIGCAC